MTNKRGVSVASTNEKIKRIVIILILFLSKALYSNCSVVRRSRKAISLVYLYLNINNNNNNNNVIYIAPFTMCSRRLEESRKKMRFKVVFEPVHMIDSTDTARQPIPKMRPSHRKGTIARLFFGTRDLKCNGQIRTETVFSFVDTNVHVKEFHRLFEKSRGSSRYCWLYFKTTLIYSRFQSMGQGQLWPTWVPKSKYSLSVQCTQCDNNQTYEVSTNNRRRRRITLILTFYGCVRFEKKCLNVCILNSRRHMPGVLYSTRKHDHRGCDVVMEFLQIQSCIALIGR